MSCSHDSRGICWLCDWDGQAWWPEARQKALDTHRISADDLHWRVRVRMAEERRRLVHG